MIFISLLYVLIHIVMVPIVFTCFSIKECSHVCWKMYARKLSVNLYGKSVKRIGKTVANIVPWRLASKDFITVEFLNHCTKFSMKSNLVPRAILMCWGRGWMKSQNWNVIIIEEVARSYLMEELIWEWFLVELQTPKLFVEHIFFPANLENVLFL